MVNASCKKCRRAGEKLFLKGERCFSQKCSMIKRPDPPGAKAKRGRRKASSEYGKQLAEKQRLKRIYGISERQFKKYVKEATVSLGDTRELLMRKLEMRLDNVVFLLGWAKSRRAARQIISHGHILINSKRVDIPSYQVKRGNVLSIHPKFKESNLIKELSATIKKHETPAWLELNKETLEGKILGQPSGDDLGNIGPVGMVVEFYSR